MPDPSPSSYDKGPLNGPYYPVAGVLTGTEESRTTRLYFRGDYHPFKQLTLDLDSLTVDGRRGSCGCSGTYEGHK